MLLIPFALAAPPQVPDPRLVVSEAPRFTPKWDVEPDERAFAETELAPLGTVVRRSGDYGTSSSVELVGTQRVRGVPCRGRVTTDTSGNWGCELGAAWSSGGLTLAAGAPVAFAIRTAHIAGFDAPATIAGVPCAGSVNIWIEGSLESCRLSAPHTFPGAPELPAGARVSMNPKTGTVFQAEFSGPVTLGGVRYGEGVELACGVFVVEFDDAGKIMRTGDQGCGC